MIEGVAVHKAVVYCPKGKEVTGSAGARHAPAAEDLLTHEITKEEVI